MIYEVTSVTQNGRFKHAMQHVMAGESRSNPVYSLGVTGLTKTKHLLTNDSCCEVRFATNLMCFTLVRPIQQTPACTPPERACTLVKSERRVVILSRSIRNFQNMSLMKRCFNGPILNSSPKAITSPFFHDFICDYLALFFENSSSESSE